MGDTFRDERLTNKAKMAIIEKNRNKLKLIIYREEKDGGIQGILLDFYMDLGGHIANEFYRVDAEGNLVKIKKGVKPLTDRGKIELAFKEHFLDH